MMIFVKRPAGVLQATVAILLLLVVTAFAQSPSGHPDDRYWVPITSFGGQIGFLDVVRSTGDEIFLGGTFHQVDGVIMRNCVRGDGEHWQPVGGAVGTQTMGMVHTIVVNGDDVYVAGMFDELSGYLSASNVAHWDGINWNTMGGGTDLAVRTLERSENGDIYVGGEFIQAGGMDVGHIARWDGEAWHDLAGGVDQHVMVALARGNDVYVGGRFAHAGGEAIGFIARWDGTAWHPLGSGVNGFVTALAFRDDQLYVGGAFTIAGGQAVRGIARWNGSTWKAVGQGFSGAGLPIVRTLCVDGTDLYAGGFFKFADGKPANYIAKWDGVSWTGLGSGLDYTVKNITRHGDDLYIVGEFETAGEHTSPYVAVWRKPAVVFDRVKATYDGGVVQLAWQVTVNESFEGYRIYRREMGAIDPILLNESALIPVSEQSYTDESAQKGQTYEYTVAAVRGDGSEIVADVVIVYVGVPFSVGQNYPNPFNPGTTIEYTLRQDAHVTLVVYDVNGGVVRRLVDGPRNVGPNSASWDGADEAGAPVSSGLYFYRLEAAGSSATRKMLLLR